MEFAVEMAEFDGSGGFEYVSDRGEPFQVRMNSPARLPAGGYRINRSAYLKAPDIDPGICIFVDGTGGRF